MTTHTPTLTRSAPLLPAVLALLLFACITQLHSQTYKIMGSDLLADTLPQALEPLEEKEGFLFDFQLTGTVAALPAIREGKADFAFIAQPDDRSSFLPDFQLFSFAYVAAYLIVHQENNLQEISFNHLRTLYMQDGSAGSINWGAIGMTGRMASRKVIPYAVSSDRAVALELFKYKALDQGQLSPQVLMLDTPEKAFQEVSKNLSAIAMVPVAPREYSGVRALAITSGSNTENYAFGPTQENIDFGDYPLRLPVVLAIPRDNPPPAEILTYLYSDEVAKILKENGFIPVPQNVRKRYLLELDIKR